MPFNKIERPDPAKILELPEEAGPMVVVTPPMQLFKDEMAYWRKAKQEADKAGDAVMRRLAEESERGIRNAAMGRGAVALMQTGNMAYDPQAVGDWYVRSTHAMAHARLLREISEQISGGSSFSFAPETAEIVVDFYTGDPYRSGIHVTDEAMRAHIGLDPIAPHRQQYYEGEEIYLLVSKPARPTDVLRTDFHEFYGEPFRPAEYTSIVPRLKTDYWGPE